MDSWVFEEFCSVAQREAGINLGRGKEALVQARVGQRVRALGLVDEKAYLAYLREDRGNAGSAELLAFLDAITTNFTSFMREPAHFEMLAALCRARRGAPGGRARPMKIWCAAAATGEEPYTIAITVREALGETDSGWKMLATDLSTRALDGAIAGRYEHETVSRLPEAYRRKYLRAVDSGTNGTIYEVVAALRENITFRRLNLARPPFPMRGPLDVVFCRNVMIYFDRPVRQALVTEIERLLAPGGTLFTGHAESLAGLQTGLEVVRPSVYRKPDAAG